MYIYYLRRVFDKKNTAIIGTIERLESTIDELEDKINEIEEEELSTYYSQTDQVNFTNYKSDALAELKELEEKLTALSKQLLGTK